MAQASLGKDNFWNRKRVENNVRYKDLVELYGGAQSKWGMYFSGQNMPNVMVVSKLCDLFGVEFNEGLEEFKKIHENWRATNGVRVYKTGTREKWSKRKMNDKQDTSVDIEPECKVIPKEDILKAVYKKVDYELFVKLQEWEGDILEALYNKVDYKTYEYIRTLIVK